MRIWLRSRTARRRRTALRLAILLAAALLTAVCVMFAEVGHPCAGRDCPVCARILRLQALLSAFAPLAVMLVRLRKPVAPARRALRRSNAGLPALTPVTLGIRMND